MRTKLTLVRRSETISYMGARKKNHSRTPAPTRTLGVRLEASASPGRVALAATLFERALRAACAALGDNDVTFVVTNYALVGEARAQNIDGDAAISIVEDVLRDPSKAITLRGDVAAEVGSVLVKDGKKLLPFKTTFRAHDGFVRTLDDIFIESVRGAVRGYRPRDATRGTTIVYSKILRVGRTREDKAIHARITVDGRDVELPIRPRAIAARFYTLAKEDRVVPVQLKATWRMTSAGPLFDPDRSSISGVDAKWRPAVGSEVAAELRAAVGGAFDNLDEVEAILGVKGEGEAH